MPRHSSRTTRTCEFCGKDFIFSASPSKIRRCKGRFCSKGCQYGYRTIPLVDRFFDGVGKKTATGCILWTKGTSRFGYGVIRGEPPISKNTSAHCVSYELMVGPIPSGLHVLHRCDNPPCINPVHLFLGTPVDNMKDKVAKNRHARGERQGLSKLTEEAVVEIRRRAAAGDRVFNLAIEYGVDLSTAKSVVARHTWKHVE